MFGRQLAQEMKEVASQRQQEEEAFYRQQKLMVDAENQRRRMISQEEQKLSDQRSRFVSVKDFFLNFVIHALRVCRWIHCFCTVFQLELTDLVKQIVLPLVCFKSILHTAIIKLILAC